MSDSECLEGCPGGKIYFCYGLMCSTSNDVLAPCVRLLITSSLVLACCLFPGSPALLSGESPGATARRQSIASIIVISPLSDYTWLSTSIRDALKTLIEALPFTYAVRLSL
jgi:hypothetical protein